MPASGLEWQGFNQVPIFPVYNGTKRKAAEGQTQDPHCCAPQSEQFAKRRCEWPQQPPLQEAALSQDMCVQDNNNSLLAAPPGGMEENHNSPQMVDQHTLYSQQQLAHPGLMHVLSQQPPRVPSPWPSQHPGLPQQSHQSDLIMDLNDEVINPRTTEAAEMEEACSSMEADGCPDPHQYAPPPPADPSGAPPTSTTDSDFCRNYCGSGDLSPASGRVRCYCKPSWEGMLDLKPYISDIY